MNTSLGKSSYQNKNLSNLLRMSGGERKISFEVTIFELRRHIRQQKGSHWEQSLFYVAVL